MKNRALVLVVVAAVSIFIGVTITVQRINNPIMLRLIAQQGEILEMQKIIQRQTNSGVAQQNMGAAVAGQMGGKEQELEARVALLEKKIDGLLKMLQNPQGPGGAPQPPSDEYTKVHQIDVGRTFIKGKKDAPVTIVEFSDFQCPFCARFYPFINEILAAYPDKVNFVLKNFPLSFHPQAKPAAKAALAAGEQGKYYEMVDLLLQNNQNLTDDNFKVLAKQLKLDVKKFTDDYTKKDAQWEDLIKADLDLGQKVDVRGTPTFYINGRKTMARDLNGFKQEIDALLNK